MSMALTHFAFGAGVATVSLSYLPVRTRYAHTIAVVSGGWAMLPDLWRVAPIWEAELRGLGHSAIGNVFWFHSLLDRMDAGDSQRLAAVVLGVYLLVTVLYAERQRDSPAFELTWDE